MKVLNGPIRHDGRGTLMKMCVCVCAACVSAAGKRAGFSAYRVLRLSLSKPKPDQKVVDVLRSGFTWRLFTPPPAEGNTPGPAEKEKLPSQTWKSEEEESWRSLLERRRKVF